MSSWHRRYLFMSRSETSPCSSFVYSQISWNNPISSHTISSTTLICTTMKNNDIFDRLSNGDMSLSYVTSISSSLIPFQISCPSNKRWPSCFNISMVFNYAKWYSPILIFLMDALLAPWNGQTQLTSLLSECHKKTFSSWTSQRTLLNIGVFLYRRLHVIISISLEECDQGSSGLYVVGKHLSLLTICTKDSNPTL